MVNPGGLLLVHGDEPFLVAATVEEWRAAAASDIEVIDAPTRMEPLLASLVDMPLFAAERHVLVRDLPQLTGARRGGAGVEELVRALALRAPTTSVCFAVRAVVTPTNPVLAAITASGGRVVHHAKLRPAERRQWLDREVRRRGLRLPAGAAEVVMRCSGGDLAVMASELAKLTSLSAAPSMVQVTQLVSGTEQLELYRVLDLLAGPQPARGAALLAGLIDEGRSTQYLLSILAGQLRDLLMAHALLLRGQRGSAQLASAMRIPAWRAERVLQSASAIPASVALAWMGELQRIDAGVKAGEVDDAAALRAWGLRAARSLVARRQRRHTA